MLLAYAKQMMHVQMLHSYMKLEALASCKQLQLME